MQNIKIVSPSGTILKIIDDKHPYLVGLNTNKLNFTVNGFYHEKSLGDWEIKIGTYTENNLPEKWTYPDMPECLKVVKDIFFYIVGDEISEE